MLQRLSDRLGWNRAPSGYRPGVTLAHLRRDLAGLDCEPLGPGLARFVTADGVPFETRERTQSELLMHLVLVEFSLCVPSREEGPARLALRHTGLVRREGLAIRRVAGQGETLEALVHALESDPALKAALMPLDFKRLELERTGSTWQVRLEHMGASEVVNRMPAFRRYIRLDGPQRALLLDALQALARLLAQH